MDWFERLTGFRETSYNTTRAQLRLDETVLQSLVNGRQYQSGTFETPSLAELRRRTSFVQPANAGNSTVRKITGDVRALHRSPEYEDALFMVASQFNLLEMVGPNVSPECGVTGYACDHTQGPACAIAAGAATIFRNYFVPVAGDVGQTAMRQLDMLADVGQTLSQKLCLSVTDLWHMQNGYALCERAGLHAIGKYLAAIRIEEREYLKSLLRIGLHHQTQVTDKSGAPQFVSQAFCSALPVAYSSIESCIWEPFARFILEAAYESTLLAGALNNQAGRSNIVVLTHLGGGAFGNPKGWIRDAIDVALAQTPCGDLDIRLVTFSGVL